MARTLNTSTADLLAPYAALTMKEAAENTIKAAVDTFEKEVREKVYAEVAKVSMKYVEFITVDPLRKPELHIIIDDREKK